MLEFQPTDDLEKTTNSTDLIAKTQNQLAILGDMKNILDGDNYKKYGKILEKIKERLFLMHENNEEIKYGEINKQMLEKMECRCEITIEYIKIDKHDKQRSNGMHINYILGELSDMRLLFQSQSGAPGVPPKDIELLHQQKFAVERYMKGLETFLIKSETKVRSTMYNSTDYNALEGVTGEEKYFLESGSPESDQQKYLAS